MRNCTHTKRTLSGQVTSCENKIFESVLSRVLSTSNSKLSARPFTIVGVELCVCCKIQQIQYVPAAESLHKCEKVIKCKRHWIERNEWLFSNSFFELVCLSKSPISRSSSWPSNRETEDVDLKTDRDHILLFAVRIDEEQRGPGQQNSVDRAKSSTGQSRVRRNKSPYSVKCSLALWFFFRPTKILFELVAKERETNHLSFF